LIAKNVKENYNIENLLGSKARVKILKILAKNEELSISQIIRGTKLNHSSVKYHLACLKSYNLVQEKVFGRIKIYRYKFENIRARSLSKFIEIWEGEL
jgi:DNA-binding transcriptional ArsR family regulator